MKDSNGCVLVCWNKEERVEGMEGGRDSRYLEEV